MHNEAGEGGVTRKRVSMACQDIGLKHTSCATLSRLLRDVRKLPEKKKREGKMKVKGKKERHRSGET